MKHIIYFFIVRYKPNTLCCKPYITMACVCKGEVWYKPTEENSNCFANIHKKQFDLIKQNIPHAYYGTRCYEEYRDINHKFNRENDSFSFSRKRQPEYKILDFVYITVDQPSRGRHDDSEQYYCQIIDKYYSIYNDYENICYRLRLLEDDSYITMDCDGDNYIIGCISYALIQNKINLHSELKKKRIETLKKATEAIIAKITQKNIVAP